MKKTVAAASLVLITIAGAGESVPVMVGGEVNQDACSGYSQVQGLKKGGDGFLAVRRGPSTNYKMIDKLYNGDQVWTCDQKGKWTGIVYGKDCGVGSPVKNRQPYKGACKSGWVFGKWLTLIAG